MKQSIQHRLQQLADRHEEISALLSDKDTINNQSRFRDLSKEYALTEPVVTQFKFYLSLQDQIQQAKQMLSEPDEELRQLAQEELKSAELQSKELEQQLKILLLPKDPDDNNNVFLEIRAGTGGDEAAIFAGDMYRMYFRFAEQKSWQSEIISQHLGEHGGFKEVIVRISGQEVYSHLKFESGAHRVQRVPETESQGRIHTSAVTVAVLPEVEEIDEIDLNMNDVRVDTYRASGAGGQHVNKTDSAIRLTHLPSGIVVECQDERSQHKNKARALALLQAKLLSVEKSKQQSELASMRKSLVGSGDRSERIRTYNYPQGRVTDHRINLTLYKLSDIMEGDLNQVIEPLVREYQAELLAELGDDK